VTRWLVVGIAAIAALGCNTGEGDGEVKSDKLYIEDCWNGAFSLEPTFFAANPSREETELIRIQRGDDTEELSDGLMVRVMDVPGIRASGLGTSLPVGLPPGVTPPGVPVVANPNPPKVSLSLYLHDTCHLENGSVYSVSGSITFKHLFSGVPDESNAEDRLTEASFTVVMADPRKVTSGGTSDAGTSGGTSDAGTSDAGGTLSVNPDTTSTVTGWFKFYYQRGQPAQPFP
jgi:hypothetical protein